MAVVIHNTTLTSGPASATSRVLLHTATAGSVLLVWNWTNEANSVSAVAAAGVPMTRLGAVSAGTSFMELWGLTSPGSGILTISAIGVGTQQNLRGLIATSYVGQRNIGGSPFGTVVGGSAVATTVNLSVSSTTTDIVAFGFAISANTTLIVNNGTTRGSATLSTVGRMVVGDIAGAATVSVSATAGVSALWGMMGVPIVASTGIRFDNAQGTCTTTVLNTIGLLLTATTNAVLLVWTNVGGGSNTISAVNVGVNALTFLGAIEYRNNSVMRAELWGLTAPPSGILTISAVMVGAAATSFGMGAATYTGHRATNPFGGVVTGSQTAAVTTSIIVSSTATNVVVVGFAYEDRTVNVDPVPAITDRVFTPGVFPRITIADGLGALAVTISASANIATGWGNLGINLIASGVAAGSAGRLSATDAPDIFAATLQNKVSGRLSATDAQDVFAAPTKVRISGLLSATEALDTFASTAKNRVSGLLSATDAPDTFASTAFNRVSGLLSATDAADSFVATGYVVVSGRLSATDAPDVFLAQGTPANRSATVAFTDPADTFAATAFNRVSGSIAATDAPDTFAASATSAALSAPAAPVIELSDPGSGGGHDPRKKRRNIPPYIRAPDDFWKARERYLLSLQPEIDAEPVVIEEEIFPDSNVTAEPAQFDPLLLISYRQERSDVIAAIPTATTMRSLRSYGDRLRLINDHILRQKRLELIAAHSELAAIQEKLRVRRKVRNLRISRLRKIHATLEIAHSLTHFYAHH